jgi:ankyrin repeat protein
MSDADRMMDACRDNDIYLVKLLLFKNINPNCYRFVDKKLETPLQHAFLNRNYEMTLILLEYGAKE